MLPNPQKHQDDNKPKNINTQKYWYKCCVINKEGDNDSINLKWLSLPSETKARQAKGAE